MIGILEFVGMILSLSAALLLAILNQDSPFILVFLMFVISNLILLIAAKLRAASNLVLMQIGFLLINFVGLFRSF